MRLKNSPRPLAAFTLLEILSVLSILLILTGLSVTLIGRVGRGNEMSSGLQKLGGTMELARQFAIAKNTYVILFLTEPVVPGEELKTALFASSDGTDPGIDLATADLQPIGKVEAMAKVKLQDRLSSQARVHNLPETDQTPAEASHYEKEVQAGGGTITFSRYIKFTPIGEVRTGNSTARYIDLVIASQESGTNGPLDEAVVRLAGLTGRTAIYRQ